MKYTYRSAALITISHATTWQIQQRWWILVPEQIVQQIVGQIDGLCIHLATTLTHIVAELATAGILRFPW